MVWKTAKTLQIEKQKNRRFSKNSDIFLHLINAIIVTDAIVS